MMLFNKKQRLDHLFNKVGLINDDLELQAHWSRYLCVLVSGFIETSVQDIFYEYSKTKSDVFVANFIERSLERFYNPKMEKILNLTGKFNLEWENQLRESTVLSQTEIESLTEMMLA